MFTHRIVDATCYQPPSMTSINNMTFFNTSATNRVTNIPMTSPSTSSSTTTSVTTTTPRSIATRSTKKPKTFYLATRTPSATATSAVRPVTQESSSSLMHLTTSSSPNTTTQVSVINATIHSTEINGMRCVCKSSNISLVPFNLFNTDLK